MMYVDQYYSKTKYQIQLICKFCMIIYLNLKKLLSLKRFYSSPIVLLNELLSQVNSSVRSIPLFVRVPAKHCKTNFKRY